jgi:hypothetical protein
MVIVMVDEKETGIGLIYFVAAEAFFQSLEKTKELLSLCRPDENLLHDLRLLVKIHGQPCANQGEVASQPFFDQVLVV